MCNQAAIEHTPFALRTKPIVCRRRHAPLANNKVDTRLRQTHANRTTITEAALYMFPASNWIARLASRVEIARHGRRQRCARARARATDIVAADNAVVL